MYSLNQVNKLVSCGRDPARSLPFWRGFLLIPLILVWLAFAPNAQTDTRSGFGRRLVEHGGRLPCPFQRHRPANSAFGWNSLLFDTTGNFNTGAGAGTLALNNADMNTAVGTAALIFNVDGARNTAVGGGAMVNNAGDAAGNGSFNGAVGAFALNAKRQPDSVTTPWAIPRSFRNINGAANTAVGDLALEE